MLKPFRLALLSGIAALLTGCGGAMSGLDLSLLNSTPASEEAAPAGDQPQLAALSPEETPPVPTRRPGKRPRAPAANATQPAPAAAPEPAQTASAENAKPEGFSLASLGNAFSSSPGEGPDSILMDKPPIEAYSLLAQRIKYCWLNPTGPRLPNHGFHAEMAPGEVREAKMVVYEKAPDGRRGTSAYKIDITAESNGALVSTRNVKLSKGDETAFKTDLARWAKGDDRCKA
jgi:hypothetical protein